MKTKRRLLLQALAAGSLWAARPGWAATEFFPREALLKELMEPGRLRVAVYRDFAPYSVGTQGIDAEIGRLLAQSLGLAAEIVPFTADEDLNDDLRNMVWKGHYLGTRPADVMLHVPVDPHLADQNDKVKICAPYHVERIAVARHPQRVPSVQGSAAQGLEVFTREKIGVETASLPDAFLLAVLSGRLREQVVHFKTVAEAAQALQRGDISAVMAPQAEIEAALRGQTQFVIEPVQLGELKTDHWLLGMAVKAENIVLAASLEQAVQTLRRNQAIAKVFSQAGVSYHAPGG